MTLGSDVRVVESCLVTPSEGTPREELRLSVLDVLLVNRGHTPTVYFYRPAAAGSDGGDNDFFDVALLKESMARALVDFYPLAGRLAADADGRHVIDCNAEGALLVVARSDLSVADFGDLAPSPELKQLFVPRIEPSSIMLAIQVTFLKCGGVAFGTALHHAAADAISSFRFFHTWSSLCRSARAGAMAEVTEAPCHDRTLLSARSPPVVNPDAFAVFCPKLTLVTPPGAVTSEVFTVSKDQVAALKRACTVVTVTGAGAGVSTFCTLSAHVWRCLCVARGLAPDATTRLTLPANVRRRVRPALPDGYFGNALIWLGTSGAVRDVTSEPLAETARRVSGAVARMDDEVVRSAVDYFELADKDARSQPGGLPETELRVISWLGMPVYDADYGWGKPELMVRAESERCGFVYLMHDVHGGVQVVVCMEAASVKKFERLMYFKLNEAGKLN